MFLLIPTNTDAPLYHPPIVTGVTILLNVVMFVVQLCVPEFTETFWLEYGSFRPHTWLTAAYLHDGFGHLFNNMIFLFIFGVIVEGKVGWWRFAIIYNVCAILPSLIIYLVTLGLVGSGLGASCAIFGIMGICFLWAPENEIEFSIFVVFILRVFHHSFEATVQIVAFLFFATNFLSMWFTGFALSSSLFHMIGLGPGLAVGWWMLKARRVDCEGHDLLSIMSGKRGQTTPTIEQEAEQNRDKEELLEQRHVELHNGLKMVDRYIEEGHFAMAHHRFSTLAQTRPKLVLSESQLVKLINGLEKDRKQDRLYRRLLRYYLDNFDRLQVAVQMKLVKRMLDDEQPRQALKQLKTISHVKLSDSQSAKFQQLLRLAQGKLMKVSSRSGLTIEEVAKCLFGARLFLSLIVGLRWRRWCKRVDLSNTIWCLWFSCVNSRRQQPGKCLLS